MEIEEDAVSLINSIPRVENCCFYVDVKSGTKLIAILGILIGLSCAALILVRGRKHLTVVESLLILFLILFLIITVIFVIISVMLLLAAVDDNPVLMSHYMWLAIVYLSAQLVLAVGIPVLLVIDGKYNVGAALVWMSIVVVVSLGWTHFISMVSTYRMNLL